MKEQHIIKYFTSLSLLLLVSFSTLAQTEIDSTITSAKDTLRIKKKYGLRLGIDLAKPVISFFDDDYQGFEIVGDYRLTRNLYIAGELGNEKKTLRTDYLDVTSSGSYFKAGADYNFYTNWLDMDNMIYGGLRLGFATFKETRNSFTIYNTDHYWDPEDGPISYNDPLEYSGLSAIWTEVVVGIKAEVFNNLYVGANVQFKYMLTQKEPNDMENLFVPGFKRTYDSGRFGFGFGYNISYLIPLYKKG